MDSSLLPTKFTIPPTPSKRVERPRLQEKLIGSLQEGKRLILVCAPAGYGKTTLVSTWLNQISSLPAATQPGINPQKTSLRAAWLSCEPEDSDPARFLLYVVAALRHAGLPVGEGLQAALHASKPPAPQTLAAILINDLLELPNRLPGQTIDRLVLVLDDFHTISGAPVQEFLSFLIEHQPPCLVVVLVTRADPDLPLARLRARGQLAEIRQNELAFSLDESADFMNRTMDLAISRDELATLENRTEGWPAGLQLAALSLRSVEDIPRFIEEFSGGHEFIADYLADEVLARLPKVIVTFLLRTSILEQFNAALCTAVTGDENSPTILGTLRENNLFLIPLDHRKEWYRYHALFADLLQNRLQRVEPGLVEELHLRASRWSQAHGRLVPAVEHALAACAFDQAAALVEQAAEPVFTSGQVTMLLRWLEDLPDEVKDRHPVLWIFHGLLPIWHGKSSGAGKTLVTGRIQGFETHGLIGEAHAVQAMYTMAEGNPSEAALLAQSALDELGHGRCVFRCLAADTLGMAKMMQAEAVPALQAFEVLAEVSAQAGYDMFEIAAHSHIAGLQYQHGHLIASAAGYQRALNLASQKMGRLSPASGNALLGLGEIARERHDLEGAFDYFKDAIEVFTRFNDMGAPIAYLSAARVKAAQGDWKTAQEMLDQARQHALASNITRLNDRLVGALQARFWIDQGEVGLAAGWALQAGIAGHPISAVIRTAGLKAAGSEFVYADNLLLARIYLAQNQAGAALEVIEPLLEVARSMGSIRRQVHILALKALALQQLNEMGRAAATIEETLTMAAPEGYLQVFIDEGEPMAYLLRLVLNRTSHPAFTREILDAFPQDTAPPGRPGLSVPPANLLEPLSGREIEVLALIAAGLSNQEIALRLHITLSTVKGHTANIYGKLGVNSRTQAVSEAVRLGVLPR